MTYTVLLVDDDPLVLDGLQRPLLKENYRVLSASSADEAFGFLSNNRVDVVVSDEMMPGILGSEFLGVVCEKYPETIRIVLTGHPNLDSALRAINKGHVYRNLIKPCSGPELGIAIKQAVQHRQLYQKSLSLLETVRRQRTMLDDLERQFPGITRVERDTEGTISIGDDLDSLIEEMGEEVKKCEYFFSSRSIATKRLHRKMVQKYSSDASRAT